MRPSTTNRPRTPSHPTWVWHRLSGGDDFSQAREKLVAEIQVNAKQSDERRAASELFADFSDEGFGNWLRTGHAFSEKPTAHGQWDWRNTHPARLPAGVAHSGLTAHRLCGAIRSKSFTIPKGRIFYRVAGKNAQIRLVIHGYRMNDFHTLLFSDCALKVDNEQFVWREQAGDLPNHVGKRAHIEVVDDGDGWVAIDEIRFADAGWKPPDKPGRVAMRVLNEGEIESRDKLAHAYGKLWQNAVERWKVNSADRAETELVEWAIENGLAFSDQETADSIKAEYKNKAAELNELAAKVPAPMRVLAAADGDGLDDRIHIRGNHRTLGDVAPRRFLEAIAGADQPDISATAGSGRLELARHVTGRQNPLFARVAVNRVWHHLFGGGIVRSTDNFGVLGERPTHPELLDYLAQQFIEDGYSLKRLIRTIVLSRTYQMASRGDESRERKGSGESPLPPAKCSAAGGGGDT